MTFATLADMQAADRIHVNACQLTASAETSDEWAVLSTILAPATTPGTVHTSDSSVFNFPDTGSDEKYMTEWALHTPSNAAQCAYALLDRLVSVQQSIATTGVKTINSAALTRYTTGAGVGVWVEVTTQTATNAAVINLNSYTNQSGTNGRTGASVTFPSTAYNIGNWLLLPLQAGDSGVRSVESINVTTAPTAGVISVVLAKPLAFGGVGPGQGGTPPPGIYDYVVPRRIFDGASLTVLCKGYSGSERTSTSITAAIS